MQEKKRYHIEELRNALAFLKQDAENLYRYDSLGFSLDFIRRLYPQDQCRLVALALASGDEDVRRVAERLKTRLWPATSGDGRAPLRLTERDQDEITRSFQPTVTQRLTSQDEGIIQRELSKAARSMGSLSLETAIWILIGLPDAAGATLLPGVGGKGSSRPKDLALADRFYYDPDSEEMAALFEKWRLSKWICHVHNHPNRADFPSSEDLYFARYWKAQRPEVVCRMRFFIVVPRVAVEYDENGFLRRIELKDSAP